MTRIDSMPSRMKYTKPMRKLMYNLMDDIYRVYYVPVCLILMPCHMYVNGPIGVYVCIYLYIDVLSVSSM